MFNDDYNNVNRFDYDSFLLSLKNDINNKQIKTIEYFTNNDENFGKIKSSSNKDYITIDNLISSHNNYQIYFKVRDIYKSYIKIGIIEHNKTNSLPSYRVLYGDKFEYLDNYTVLNNVDFKISLKIINNSHMKLIYDNIFDLIIVGVIDIAMNSNTTTIIGGVKNNNNTFENRLSIENTVLTNIINAKFSLKDSYFQYGNIAYNNLIGVDGGMDSLKLLYNMVIPNPIYGKQQSNIGGTTSLSITILGLNSTNIKIVLFDDNFKFIKSVGYDNSNSDNGLQTSWNNITKTITINEGKYFYLAFNNKNFNQGLEGQTSEYNDNKIKDYLYVYRG